MKTIDKNKVLIIGSGQNFHAVISEAIRNKADNSVILVDSRKPIEFPDTEAMRQRRMFVKCNLAVVLADVADSLMMEFEAELKHSGKELKHEVKMRYGLMKQAGRDFKIRVKDVAKDGYHLKAADSFCEDSDWLKEVLMLMVDRVGGDAEKMEKLKAMIHNMQSEMIICQ